MKIHSGKGYPFPKTKQKNNPVLPAKEQGRIPNQGRVTIFPGKREFLEEGKRKHAK